MRVALDAQLAVGTATGIGVYQRDLALALRAAGTDVRDLQAPWLDPWRFDRRVLWDQVVLPILAARSGASVLHASAGTLPLVRTLPTIVTVHDMAWLHVQSHTRAYARAYFGTLMRRAYARADTVVVDSDFSRQEFTAAVGDRDVHVIFPGVDARFAAMVRTPAARPFALAVGTVERRKNLIRAVEAIAAVPGIDLVAAGPPTPYIDDVRARIAELGVADRVSLRGYITRAELDALYATATVALVPSTYEGFGYALAEALCAGVPVLAARSSSLIEVAAAGTPLLDPHDGDAWIEALRALVADRDAAQRHADAARPHAIARFGWTRAAAAFAALYARCGQ